MPVEYAILKGRPVPLESCPKCGRRFEPFMRGMVQSWWRKALRWPYCAVICGHCKEIVGHDYAGRCGRDDSDKGQGVQRHADPVLCPGGRKTLARSDRIVRRVRGRRTGLLQRGRRAL